MTNTAFRFAAAATLAAAAALVAPSASADQAKDDCAKLKTVIERDEQKLEADAQGLGGHIHTLIHAARLVAADAETMSTDVTGAHVQSQGLAKNTADFASSMHDLGTALKGLIGVLEPLAGTTAQHNGLHQRIQTVTTDVAQHCQGQNPSPDCAALMTKMRDLPQDASGGPSAMADRITAYATAMSGLTLKDPALKQDATDWASIFRDIATGLRGVASFQTQFQSVQQRADTAGNAMKSFCSQHE